jgi:hypothetical protein
MTNGSGALGDLKIENSKNQTFNSDLEDSASVHGLVGNNLVSIIVYVNTSIAITPTHIHAK